MKFVRSLALTVNILFVFQSPLWAQTFDKGPEYKTVSPRTAAPARLPKWMRDAKPMPLPSIPENSQPPYEGPGYNTISPRTAAPARLPKWMRDAKPMPLPTIPQDYRHPSNEKIQSPQ